MTYNANIPNSTDRIADSQPSLLTNFGQLNLVYGDPVGPPIGDHFAFDDTSVNARKHRKVSLPDQTAIPPVTTLTNLAIFAESKTGGRGAGAQFTRPYYVRDDVANTVQYPVSPVIAFGEFVVPTGVLSANTFGITSVTPGVAGRYVVVLADPMPAADTNYTISLAYQCTGINPMPLVIYQDKTNTQFEVQIITTGGLFSNSTVTLISLAVLRY